MAGIGLIDPVLARDLANSAAANPRTTWCVTVTDQDGHAIGHGCARPEPRSHARRRDKQGKPGPPGGPDPPRGTSNTTGPGFSFTASGQHGPPDGYGTWRLRTRGHGPDLVVALDPITTEGCDHCFAAQGHDPGSSCGTWLRSGTPPAPAPSVGARNGVMEPVLPVLFQGFQRDPPR